MNKTYHIPTDPEPRPKDNPLGTPDECPRCLSPTDNACLCDACDDEVDL